MIELRTTPIRRIDRGPQLHGMRASIRKESISDVADFKGSANVTSVLWDGKRHPPGTIVFAGFRGSHAGGQQYDGIYCFRAVDTPVDTRFDFAALPGLGPVTAPTAEGGD